MSAFVIGITGKASSGKDTIADYLVEYYGFTKFKFADRLRDMLLDLDPIVGHETDNWSYGDSVEYTRLSELVDEFGWEEAKKEPEVRRLMQVFGTDVMRKWEGEDYWINALSLDIRRSSCDKAVISDVRFLNEAEWCKYHGMVMKVVRPTGAQLADSAKAHPSETKLDSIMAQVTIRNDLSIDYLHDEVDAIMPALLRTWEEGRG